MKRGVMAIFFGFIFLSIVLIFLFFVGNPMTLLFLTEAANMGQDILDGAEINISNPDINSAFNDTIVGAQTSITHSAEITSVTVQYGWLIILFALLLYTFIVARSFVETGGKQGGNVF